MKPGILLPGFFLIAFISLDCQNRSVENKLSKVEGGSLSTEQLEETMLELLTLEGEITTRPDDIDLKKKFVETSFDRDRRIFRAAGFGRPPINQKNHSMAIEAAKQAAYMDGCRWLLYAQGWKQNPGRVGFGKIEGELKGAKIVHSNISKAAEATVLVEMPAQNTGKAQ